MSKSDKGGPASIRVTLNRELTEAEREAFREAGEMVAEVEPTKFRMAQDGRIYATSSLADSRTLFSSVARFVEQRYVNVFPVAVMTFRELTIPEATQAATEVKATDFTLEGLMENFQQAVRQPVNYYGNRAG